jgi:hypothetical protein
MTARLNRIPRVHPTRPSLLHRLRTWWLARPHRQDYADAVADHAVAQLQVERCQQALSATLPYTTDRYYASRALERWDSLRHDAVVKATRALAALHALGVAP